MNCQDARERFSALLDGELGLTEWAETEAHVKQCTECAATLEELHRLRPPDEPGRRRPPMAYVGEPSHWRNAIAPRRRRQRLPVAFRLFVGAAAITMVTGIVFYAWPGRSAVDIATRALVSRATSQYDAPSAKPAPSPWPRENSSAARPDVSPSPGSSGAVDSLPAPKTVTPSASPPAMPPVPSTPRQVGTASAEAARPAPAPPVASTVKTESKEALNDSRADVVVQLSVQNRREAERNVTTLLELLGGSTVGKNRSSTIMAVLPRSSYEDFTRGLAQLGSSQMETEGPSLPDPVHVAIRLAR
jgi:hypothetical protein